MISFSHGGAPTRSSLPPVDPDFRRHAQIEAEKGFWWKPADVAYLAIDRVERAAKGFGIPSPVNKALNTLLMASGALPPGGVESVDLKELRSELIVAKVDLLWTAGSKGQDSRPKVKEVSVGKEVSYSELQMAQQISHLLRALDLITVPKEAPRQRFCAQRAISALQEVAPGPEGKVLSLSWMSACRRPDRSSSIVTAFFADPGEIVRPLEPHPRGYPAEMSPIAAMHTINY